MLENFNNINFSNLQFINRSKYQQANEYRDSIRNYPIAILDDRDIEIHFLHYNHKMEAIEKWTRRSKRINFDNIFIVFSDRDGCSLDDIKRFDNLSYKNKVFISVKKYDIKTKNIVLDLYKNEKEIGDIYNNRWAYRRRFNIAKWLNS